MRNFDGRDRSSSLSVVSLLTDYCSACAVDGGRIVALTKIDRDAG